MARKDDLNVDKNDDHPEALPGVATPDQTRTDGAIEDPGTLARAATAGITENRKRKGNLTGM